MTDRLKRADDCEAAIRALAAAPSHGLSIDQLAHGTGWSRQHANDILCDLMGKIRNHRVRVAGQGNVVHYFLKERSQP